jgi:hypothetical protein
MQLEDPVNMDDMGIPEINTVILLDREVDMVTPMCSQLTYEGLLDEVDKSFSSWHRSLDNENMICLCLLLTAGKSSYGNELASARRPDKGPKKLAYIFYGSGSKVPC